MTIGKLAGSSSKAHASVLFLSKNEEDRDLKCQFLSVTGGELLLMAIETCLQDAWCMGERSPTLEKFINHTNDIVESG